MERSSKFDAVIIGGGHNGLVCAAYLARAGLKVCVLERRNVLGGCATTEAIWPGYKVSTAAYVISLFLPEIIRELKLKEYGLTILPRSPSSFTPLPDGRSLLLGPDPALCHREIAKFSMDILTKSKLGAGASDREKAMALVRHLAGGEYTYSLNRRKQDTTIDPTEDFLFNVKEGHCVRDG